MKLRNYDLIRSPLLTEKSTILGSAGKYVFLVDKSANKSSVKNAIESIFEVKVEGVNMINQSGKIKRFKGVIGRRSDTKKAIVTLKEDYSIDLTGGVK